VYSRTVENRILTFGVSGKLWKNALVMYDRETKTLWSHLTGEAIEGPLKGHKLKMISSLPKMKWKAWQAIYPNTQVLSVNGEEDLRRDAYIEYHVSNRTGLFQTEHKDKRLNPKDMVIGVKTDHHQKAYPLKHPYWKMSQNRSSTKMIQDELDGIPILVYFNAETYATAVYDRRLNETKQITFEKETQNHFAHDTQGNTWHLLTGQGPDGQFLKPIPHVRVYWFAWVDFYPQTLLYIPSQ